MAQNTKSKPLKTKKIHLLDGCKFNLKVQEVYGLNELYVMTWCEDELQDTYLYYHINGQPGERHEKNFEYWQRDVLTLVAGELGNYCEGEEDLNFWLLNDLVKRGLLPAGTYALDASELV